MRGVVSLGLAGCVGVLGCGGNMRTLGPDGGAGGGGGAGAGAFVQGFSPNARDVDILFMIDNSLGMQPMIVKTVAALPVFTQALQPPPLGLPSVHIAVVSANLGAGQWTGIPLCPVGGDGGQFQFAIGAGTTESGGVLCVNTGLNANQHFISNENGVANYDTTVGLDKVLGCIASLGDHGCGYEHQIASVVRALNADGEGLPAVNAGFLRRDARLAIILVTNEDDCSAPPDTDLFDTSSKSVSDPFGPLTSYRCNEFGHLCNGVKPPRTMAASFPPGACVPAEEAGKLIPVADLANEIKALKYDSSKILMVAIAGPPDPYSVSLEDATPQTSDANAGVKWPVVEHSCTANSGDVADPAVRIKALVDAFGANGIFIPACAPTYDGAMQTIGQLVAGDDPSCLNAVPRGVVAASPVAPASCGLTDDAGAVVPTCPAPAGNACWELAADPMCQASGIRLNLNANGAPFTPTNSILHCS